LTKELTDGERRVFKAYLEEETHELAAAKLKISTQTLKNHLGAIYKKVGRRKAHSTLYAMAQERHQDPLAPLTPPKAENHS
jgi:DNA-binding CsgD family transcriptional regulator